MDLFSPEMLLLLFGAGLLAGFVDAIAGGGGLIGLPILLSVGLTPTQALATNKLQSAVGTFTATANFVRKGHIDLKAMALPVALTFAGSASGTILVQSIDSGFLADILPFLLIAIALYFLFRPQLGESDRQQRMGLPLFGFICGFGIGFYDGFFGPGTGSFFTIAFIALLGFNLLKATANTKLLNLTSNVAAMIFFVLGGNMVWLVGLVMAAGQVFGGYLGSHMTMRHGAKIVRPLLVLVSVLMTVKLVYSDPDHIIRQWFVGLIDFIGF